MYYGNYPYGGWPSPWRPPMGMGDPMMGGWDYPYGGMGQMPYYPPWGGFSGMPPYGQPMPGSYVNPGMPPYGQPGPGGYANQEMPYGQPMAGPGGYGSPGMPPYGQPMPGNYVNPGMPPYGQPMPPEQEIEFLKDQAHMLKDQLDQIDARIQELERETK